MLWSQHKCANANHCFCDLTSLSAIFIKLYQNPYVDKAAGETCANLWLNQETFVTKLQNIIVLP